MTMRFNSRTHAFAKVLTLGTAAALLLSGCGSSGTGAESASQLDEVAELAALVPAPYSESGTLKVAVNPDMQPIKFVDDNGDFAGFTVDIFSAASSVLGLEADFQQASFDALMPGMDSGAFDAILSISDFEDRHDKLTFIDYINSGVAYVARPDSELEVNSVPEDLCGYTVAFIRGTGSQTRTEDNVAKCAELGLPELKPVGYQDANAAFLAVQTGEDDFVHIDSPPAVFNAANSPDHFEVLYIEYTAPLGIAFRASEEELSNAFREALLHLVEEGVFAEIAKEWGVEDEVTPDFPINLGLTS